MAKERQHTPVVSLSQVINGAVTELRKGKCDLARHYAYSLETLLRHLEETARGEHTWDRIADYYCLPRAALSKAEGR